MKTAKNNASDKLLTLLQQAIALHNQQRLDEADAIYKKVLLQAPQHADALHLRALVCHAKNRFADAARFAEAAIDVAPQVANFQNTAGEAWRRHGRLDLAQKYLQQAIRLAPTMAMAHLNLSLVLSSSGRLEEALACAKRALELNPAYIEALAQALSICCALGDHATADSYAQNLARNKGNRIATEALGRYHNHLARSHRKQQRWNEAAAETDRALVLYPDFWGNWALRAEMSNDALDFSSAELYCAVAANLAPDNEDARLNIGHLLQEQKRLEEAESHYAAWLDAHPDSDAARFGLASIKLLRGEFEAGWKNYESRWGLRRHGGGVRNTSAPTWNGGACARLLLYAEQGLGDTIQMLRFLPQVVQRCAGAVTLQVPPALLRIARRAVGAQAVEVLTQLPDDAAFDSVCPLMSLPHVLQAHSAEALGMSAPYIAADEQRRAFFDTALSGLQGKKIGIVWQGSAAGLTNHRRPFALDALAPLLSIPGIALVSLQFGAKKPMIGTTPIKDLSDHIQDFDDLAAAMMALDAVISVDTGPAHLAGALGLPTYTIIPWLHDWRWGIDGEKSYWYPSMTLVRQTQPKDWTSTVENLASLIHPAYPAVQGAAALSAFPAPDDQAIGKNQFPFVHVNCRPGKIVAPLFDPAAARSLLLYGEHVQRECELLASYLHAGDTMVDIGAGLGVQAICAAHAVGAQGRVIAFESNKTLHRCLAQSMEINRLPWVEARREAVGRRPGKLKQTDNEPAMHNANGGRARPTAETIAVVSLDGLRLERCVLVRINAHGHELDVLEGARALIDQCRPVLYLNCEQQDTGSSWVKFFKDRGYSVFRCATPVFQTQNYRNCQINLFAQATSAAVLALPSATLAAPQEAQQL